MHGQVALDLACYLSAVRLVCGCDTPGQMSVHVHTQLQDTHHKAGTEIEKVARRSGVLATLDESTFSPAAPQ